MFSFSSDFPDDPSGASLPNDTPLGAEANSAPAPEEDRFAPIAGLLSKLESNRGKHYDFPKIKDAYLFANELHAGQKRVSGEPYISHPIAVAEIVAELGLDTDSICAALLHDTVEDCSEKVSIEIIRERFGEQTAMLVDGLTKLVQLPFSEKDDPLAKDEQDIENLRKMFLAMSKDIRVIFIKLCDRLHNMRTLDAKPENKRRLTALETMQVYAPLAHRLGIQKIKQELENLSLSYLDPIGYAEVQKDIERRYGQNRDFLRSARVTIEEKLREQGFRYMLEGRVKSVYSIYKKMYEQGKSFDEIYDFYALRIITETELDCYTILGIIHDMFKSMPGRFKDYISTPKTNMYRSLHTTVIGREGIPFEVQIRTYEMHKVAEYGIAAHWKYKSGEQSDADMDKKLEWISKLVEDEKDTMDPDEFLRSLKIDMFQDETFVFTPKGDVITLPVNSTVIDFAYAIHSEVGNHMVGAKVNGVITPIDSKLENGQIVEILTSSSAKGPSRDWLKIVRTGEARNKIRQWFKKEKRTENIAVGKAEIDREFRRYGRPYTETQKNEIVTAVAGRLGMSSADDFYNTVGFGGLSVTKLSMKLRDEFLRVTADNSPKTLTAEEVAVKPSKKHSGGVVIDGVEGLAVKFARCCNPLPGDSIVGFITKGYGVSVHKSNCPNILSSEGKPELSDRIVSAHWEQPSPGSEGDSFDAYIRVTAEPSLTLIADIARALADMRVSLHQISTKKQGEHALQVSLTVSCRGSDHLRTILAKLRTVPGVLEAERGYVA